MKKIPLRIAFAIGLSCLSVAPSAQAQDYPSRPIRLVIPFPPGGGTDGMARMIGQKLHDVMGQPVIIDNRPGGDTIIAAELTARAAPDGYTLNLAHFSTMALNPVLYPKLPYDPLKDFAPISQVTYTSMGIVGNKNIPAKDLKELVAYAKEHPGKVTYGTAVLVAKMLGVSMKSASGTDMQEIPYRGSGQILQALLAGQIDLAIVDLSQYVPFIQKGDLHALATTGPTRYVQLPDTPTMRESGYPAIELRTWFGLFAPARTPRPIIDKLNAALRRVLTDPAVVSQLQTQYGYDAVPGTPEELTALIKSDSAKWGAVIKASGITPYAP
jgi:tripartite-type tricarboxylate transporter receptor subunit TctC